MPKKICLSCNLHTHWVRPPAPRICELCRGLLVYEWRHPRTVGHHLRAARSRLTILQIDQSNRPNDKRADLIEQLEREIADMEAISPTKRVLATDDTRMEHG